MWMTILFLSRIFEVLRNAKALAAHLFKIIFIDKKVEIQTKTNWKLYFNKKFCAWRAQTEFITNLSSDN